MHLKEKLKFVIKTLTDQDARNILQAYNGLRENKNVLNNTGLDKGDEIMKKTINRLRDKGFDLQCQAFKQLVDYYKATSSSTRSKYQIMKNICYRISDKAKRVCGQALRMLRVHAKEDAENDRRLFQRQRGIMNRMVDANARLMSAGFNKLVEEYK